MYGYYVWCWRMLQHGCKLTHATEHRPTHLFCCKFKDIFLQYFKAYLERENVLSDSFFFVRQTFINLQIPWIKERKLRVSVFLSTITITNVITSVYLAKVAFKSNDAQQHSEHNRHFTFSLSEDRGLSIAGFGGQSIPQSQTACRKSPHQWHKSSCSWRHSSQPDREEQS